MSPVSPDLRRPYIHPPDMRTSYACVRCRRQKLKCDAEKPCLLCRRVGVECEPRSSARRSTGLSKAPTSRSSRKSSATQSCHLEPNANPTGQTHHGRVETYSVFNLSTPPASAYSESITHRTQVQDEPENHEFGANNSSIGFAKNLYGKEASNNPKCAASIPTESRINQSSSRTWTLHGINMPDVDLMQSLIDEYFRRTHWFIFVFHEPTLRNQAKDIMAKSSWATHERGTVLTTLMVAAMALQAVSNDEGWPKHATLRQKGLDCTTLIDQLVTEVRYHLLDLLEDGRIEAVQVCILLGTFYIFHGNPKSAWSVLGMATRAGYALGLHSQNPGSSDPVRTQIRRRCWNHLKVADTYASMIFGRPTSLDPAFGSMQPLEDIDDTIISTKDLSISVDAPSLSRLAFYRLKYRMYEIIAEILSRFRLLQIRSSPNSSDWTSLLQIIHEITEKLDVWRSSIPLHLQYEHWKDMGVDGTDPHKLADDASRSLFMQAMAVQYLYDSTVILLHRPVLENTISTFQSSETPKSTQTGEPFKTSLSVSVSAALRISHAPIEVLTHQTIISYALMHLFTAGVILCIPPHTSPLNTVAQTCKSAVVRIIICCRKLRDHSPVAGLTQQLLSDLLRITIQREMDAALLDEGRNAELSDVPAATTYERRNNGDQMTPIYDIAAREVPTSSSSSGLMNGYSASGLGSDTSGYWASSNTPITPQQSSPDERSIAEISASIDGNRYDPDSSLRSLYYNDWLDPPHEVRAVGPAEFMWPFQAFGNAMFGLGTEPQLPL
ncbi:uncharacterized protein PV09_02602 [Verruconis gallopava]|uniref:Zn(2)-C6 fungal-type domain-containing protein n=1 Tax=Verruconis gallopava TaxID=253628 RepID=A0A0D1XW05_9PEZI|nr:uncharacterized protein PV09_02602 [Verruconis gallopava]KIW06941.1 hypothetical protein PV09_02602 [Verruconis gallopava]